MNNDTPPNKIVTKIKLLLASHIGIDPSEITEEDEFMTDLHMQASDLSDFLEELSSDGLDTSGLDLSTIKTVGDLVEALSSHEYFA
jgi:acyl carrier protein